MTRVKRFSSKESQRIGGTKKAKPAPRASFLEIFFFPWVNVGPASLTDFQRAKVFTRHRHGINPVSPLIQNMNQHGVMPCSKLEKFFVLPESGKQNYPLFHFFQACPEL